jgi:hypothetical protein
MMDKPTKRKGSIKVQWAKLLLVTVLAFTSLPPIVASADSPPKPGQPGVVKPPLAPPSQPKVSWNT